jgi:hypothetical protein
MRTEVRNAMNTTNETLGDATWNVIANQLLAIGQNKGSFTVVWIRLEPEIDRWLRSPSFLGRVSDDEDHRREIIVRTWIKLQQRDHERVRLFATTELAASASPQRHARCWLRRVVKNIGIDYVRGLPEYVRSEASWRVLDAVNDELCAEASDPHAAIEAGQLLDALDERANTRRGLYRIAIEMWLAGYDTAEIARACELESAAAADRILGAAKELLRRRFRAARPALVPDVADRRRLQSHHPHQIWPARSSARS